MPLKSSSQIRGAVASLTVRTICRNGANAMEALTLATEGQIEQITRVVNDAVKKTLKPLDKDATQRVHARGDELTAGITKLIVELSVSDRYSSEVASSSYAYPKSYRPKPIGEQIEMLSKAFGLDPTAAYTYANNLPKLPEGAEDWFAVVRSEALAEEHGEAIEKVLAVIEARRSFYNYRKGELTPAHVRRSARTTEAMKTLCENQEGDILVIPAQLGMRHRGKSVRRAIETFVGHEFGLDSVSVGSIAITHPERFQQYDELDPDCAGDEYCPDADGGFSGALYFCFSGDELEFGRRFTAYASKDCGTASGFLPQK